MRQERSDHTLQPTALVHEAYLRLVRQREMNWQNKAHFFAIAATLMRRILVDYARARTREKRGGTQRPIHLDEALLFSEEAFAFSEDQSEELIKLDLALTQLAKEYPRQAQVVEQRFFTGLTVEQIAGFLNVSPKTVKRDWNHARLWLHREIRTGNVNDTRAARTDL